MLLPACVDDPYWDNVPVVVMFVCSNVVAEVEIKLRVNKQRF